MYPSKVVVVGNVGVIEVGFLHVHRQRYVLAKRHLIGITYAIDIGIVPYLHINLLDVLDVVNLCCSIDHLVAVPICICLVFFCGST